MENESLTARYTTSTLIISSVSHLMIHQESFCYRLIKYFKTHSPTQAVSESEFKALKAMDHDVIKVRWHIRVALALPLTILSIYSNATRSLRVSRHKKRETTSIIVGNGHITSSLFDSLVSFCILQY
jgi:hypothetical protein